MTCRTVALSLLLILPQCAVADNVKSDVAGFKTIVAPFFKSYCVDCHSGESPEAKLSLDKIDPDVLKGRDFETWRLIAERLRFREMPPKDYDQPKTVERERVRNWLHRELLKTQQPGVAPIAKLTLPEYGNYVDHQELFNKKAGFVVPVNGRLWRIRPSIYDALITRIAHGKPRGLSDPFNLRAGSRFKDFASMYFIDGPTTAMLLSNAEKIVDHQLNDKNHFRELREFVGDGAAPTRKQMARAVHTEFRLALYRTPTQRDIERYSQLHAKVAKVSGHVIAGKTMLMAILMQPEALFRFELGQGKVDKWGRRRLSQREIAFALSLSLGNHLDTKLLALASARKLADRASVAAYLMKRLKDFDDNPRLMQFFREYFGYPNVVDVFKDQPEKGRHDPKLLMNDIEVLVRHITKNDKNVLHELLTTNEVFIAAKVDTKTRKLRSNWDRKYPLGYQTTFGLPTDWRWTNRQPISLPKDERVGVLTHPAWLAAWGGNFDNHPVQRGKWIRTHLLGGTVPDVPIGVDARIPDDEHKQLGERLAKVTRKAECWRCHKKMNPLGTPFEQYDHYGRYRRFETKRPVQVEGEINYTGDPNLDGKAKNIVTLMHRLAKSEHVEQVFVRHAFRFFLGRNETLGDAKTLQDAHQAYRNSGGSYRALVTSLLSSDSFLFRRADSSVKSPEKSD